MPIAHLSREMMDRLLSDFEENRVRRQLGFIYRQIPANKCERCADCCFASAEVLFSEFINIYSYVQSLPENVQNTIAERVIRYEFLSLMTLDYKCPFLEDKNCLIYEVRPLQCRFFGLYPRQEYSQLRENSLNQNTQLAQYYARIHRLLLPKEVMTYDIDQCNNNFDDQGRRIIFTSVERDLIYNQVFTIHDRLLPDLITLDEDELNRFTFLYSLVHFNSDELLKMRVEIAREYLNTQKTTKLDNLLKQHKFDFGIAKVRSIEARVKS